MNNTTLIRDQRSFFNSNLTKEPAYRKRQLNQLKSLLRKNEQSLYEAIYADFGKSEYDTYVTELAIVYHEINTCLKNLDHWSRKKRVSTNLANWPSSSYIIPEPLGVSLVIGAWNYPINLLLVPVVSAMAAGNTVVIKPSELPNRVSAFMANLFNNNFPSEYVHVVEGGVETTTDLLNQHFDKIFFTGSTRVGKIVYQAAAKNLTPVTLELGGKSPAIVLSDSNLKITARRIVWGKFLNTGQTCIAPDYVLVDESIKTEFLKVLVGEIRKHHPDTEDIYENYTRIINKGNFERLSGFIDQAKVHYGGRLNKGNLFIGPTVLDNITWEDPVMQEEIFGPILPVLSFSDLDSALEKIKTEPKPLACYVFTNSKRNSNKVLSQISFGGGAINDTVMHITNPHLPFGGVGTSGMGNYHGYNGFQAFSHFKSILDRAVWFELPLKYTPYTKLKRRIIKLLLE